MTSGSSGRIERGLRQPGRGDRPRRAGRGPPARARSARRRRRTARPPSGRRPASAAGRRRRRAARRPAGSPAAAHRGARAGSRPRRRAPPAAFAARAATSATNRRFWASAASSRPIVSAEGLGHPVEPLGPRPELVVRGDRHARGQVAALDPLRGPAGGLDRGEDAAGDDPGDEQRERGSGPAARRSSASRSWPSAISSAVDVVDEVERRPAAPTAGHRRPGCGCSRDRRPGVGELAGVDPRDAGPPGASAERARELRRSRRPRLAAADVDDRLDAALAEGLAQAGCRRCRRASGPPGARASGSMTDRSNRAWAAASSRTCACRLVLDEQVRPDARAGSPSAPRARRA